LNSQECPQCRTPITAKHVNSTLLELIGVSTFDTIKCESEKIVIELNEKKATLKIKSEEKLKKMSK